MVADAAAGNYIVAVVAVVVASYHRCGLLTWREQVAVALLKLKEEALRQT